MATLKEKLNAKVNSAESATNKEVAEMIWNMISERFDSFSKYELERLEYISAVIHVNSDILVLEVTKQDNITKVSQKEYALTEIILLSANKLKELDQVMELVMQMAEEEQIISWKDDGSDHGFERGDGKTVYGFAWFNGKYQ